MSKRSASGKPDPRQEDLNRGRTLLAAWGIHDGALPPGTPGQQVVATLSPLIGRDPACDLLIAEWLGRTTDAAAALKLAEWETSAAEKDLKREIRRALFKLEQKGIKVERHEEPRPAFSLGVKPAEPEGYLGAVDGDGARSAWLLRRDTGGYTGIFAVIHDQEGMVSVSAGSITKNHLAETIAELASSGPGAPARVPWPYADALMHAAFRKAAPRPGHARADYLLSRSEITVADAADATVCPIVSLIPAEAVADPDLLDKSAELFKEREFGAWALPQEAARPHLEALADLNKSGLVLSKEVAAERFTAILDAALEAFVAAPTRPIYARRLEEMAYLFHVQERERPARLSLAVSVALRSPEGRTMKEISFLRAFVFRAFVPSMMRDSARHGDVHDHAHDHGAPEGPAPRSETAEGSSIILDPSKVREKGVPGAGRVDDIAAPGMIIRP